VARQAQHLCISGSGSMKRGAAAAARRGRRGGRNWARLAPLSVKLSAKDDDLALNILKKSGSVAAAKKSVRKG